jgi:hypothetical protein
MNSDSPVRPFRQPRFSGSGQGSPNENCPSFPSNGEESNASFPRQFMSSPAKFNDRNVLLLMGSKVPSSVPGRRSSIACTKDRKALAPLIIFEDTPLFEEEIEQEAGQARQRSQADRRAKSQKATSTKNLPGPNYSKPRTLKRL